MQAKEAALAELKDMTSSFTESDKRRKNAESALSEAQSRISEDTSRIQDLTSQNDKMKVGVWVWQVGVVNNLLYFLFLHV